MKIFNGHGVILKHMPEEAKEEYKDIFTLAWPCVLEQVLAMMAGIVTTMLIGHLGNAALTGVGFVNTLVTLFQASFAALSTGATVLIARLTGAKEHALARDAVKQTLILALGSSVIATTLCYIFRAPILHLFLGDIPQDVFDTTMSFFCISILSFPTLIINVILAGTFRGVGDSRTPMIINVLINIINAGVGYLLIYPFHLGVQGAGYAILLARSAGMVLFFTSLFSKKARISIHLSEGIHLNWDLIKRMLRIGIPASIEQIVLQGGFLMLQSTVVRMGTVHAATYSVANSINSICSLAGNGLSIAISPLVGQSLGAKRPDKAESYVWKSLSVSLPIMMTIAALIFLFPEPLSRMYTSDADVLSLSRQALHIVAFASPFLACVQLLSAAMRGAGDIYYVTFTSIIGVWVFRNCLTLVIDRFYGLGVLSVYIAMILDLFIRSVLYLIRFKKGRWKLKVV